MRIDAWTLRCLFNRGKYLSQIESGELVALHSRESPIRSDGSKTVQVYYGRPDSRFLVVRLQWVQDMNGRILGSGQKDPKHLYVQEHAIRSRESLAGENRTRAGTYRGAAMIGSGTK